MSSDIHVQATTLLTLPLEIRELIWELVFLPTREQQRGRWDRKKLAIDRLRCPWDWATCQMTQLLRVNKQIYYEASHVLYSKLQCNIYANEHVTEPVLEKVPHRWRAAITSVTVTVPLDLGSSFEDTFVVKITLKWKSVRKILPNLQTVLIRLQCNDWFSVPDPEAINVLTKQFQECLEAFRDVPNVQFRLAGLFEQGGQPKLELRRELVRRLQDHAEASRITDGHQCEV